MTLDSGDGTAQNFEQICIIKPKMNEIGAKVRKKWDLKNFYENLNIF